MPDGTGNGPSVTEIARRLQRVEDKLDERIVTTDMLQAVERLFDAKLAEKQVAISDQAQRLGRVENAQSKFVFALLGAFLLLLVQFLIIAATATGKG